MVSDSEKVHPCSSSLVTYCLRHTVEDLLSSSMDHLDHEFLKEMQPSVFKTRFKFVSPAKEAEVS